MVKILQLMCYFVSYESACIETRNEIICKNIIAAVKGKTFTLRTDKIIRLVNNFMRVLPHFISQCIYNKIIMYKA